MIPPEALELASETQRMILDAGKKHIILLMDLGDEEAIPEWQARYAKIASGLSAIRGLLLSQIRLEEAENVSSQSRHA